MEGRQSNATRLWRRIRDALVFRDDIDLCDEDEPFAVEVSSSFHFARLLPDRALPNDIQRRRPAY